MGINSPNTHNVSNIQVRNCWYGFEAHNSTLNMQNILGHNNMTFFWGDNMAFRVEHATVHTGHQLFAHVSGGSGALYLTNSVVVKMTNSSSGVTWVSSTNLANDSGLFQSAGTGANYLAAGSPYRNVGGLMLSANMLAILKKTTTYPPLALTGTISVPTTLTPQAQRDTDTPDLGYHYYPLDYLAGNLTVAGGASLLLTNGVSVGIHSTNGIVLDSGAQLISQGQPHLMNRLVRHQLVQEQPDVYGTTGPNMTLIGIVANPATKPDIYMRFTELSVPGDTLARRTFCNSSEFNSMALRDCRLWNLSGSYDAPGGSAVLALTNNILERCDFSFTRSMNLHQMTVEFWNNYASRSALTFNYASTSGSPPTWTIRDNFFDMVTLSATGSAPYVACSYNGYFGTTVPSLSAGNDRAASSLDFQTGPLGGYYYPATNSPSATGLWTLVDTGSRLAADAAHYHYTTRVDQAKEVSAVDIGFHYVSVDANGIPIDSDADGLADYLEDTDEDGYSLGDLTDWQAYNSVGGLSGTTGLQTFTPIK
jgi:hypothetical protein